MCDSLVTPPGYIWLVADFLSDSLLTSCLAHSWLHLGAHLFLVLPGWHHACRPSSEIFSCLCPSNFETVLALGSVGCACMQCSAPTSLFFRIYCAEHLSNFEIGLALGPIGCMYIVFFPGNSSATVHQACPLLVLAEGTWASTE